MPAANVRPVHLDEPLKPERIPQHVVDMASVPSPERLAKPHQRVTLKNTPGMQDDHAAVVGRPIK
jgi:hypothetical protein